MEMQVNLKLWGCVSAVYCGMQVNVRFEEQRWCGGKVRRSRKRVDNRVRVHACLDLFFARALF